MWCPHLQTTCFQLVPAACSWTSSDGNTMQTSSPEAIDSTSVSDLTVPEHPPQSEAKEPMRWEKEEPLGLHLLLTALQTRAPGMCCLLPISDIVAQKRPRALVHSEAFSLAFALSNANPRTKYWHQW